MKFRARFTLRTLALIVTLVAAYFGAWEATKKYGPRDFVHRVFQEMEQGEGGYFRGVFTEDGLLRMLVSEEGLSVPMPFVISVNSTNGPDSSDYYLWFFGAIPETLIVQF